MLHHLLIIDDEPQLRRMLSRLFEGEGFAVTSAENGAQAMQRLKAQRFHVVLCDVKLPDANGVELTNAIKSLQPDAEVIVFTAFGRISDAVKAVQNGAFHYLVKGDDNDKLIPTVSRALEKAMAQRHVVRTDHDDPFEAITGRSPAIQQVITLARKVAPTEASVLLTGATGTGKEVFAQAIHAASGRARKPFVAVNCGALSRDLLETELFGHVAGAFTGAVKDRKGLIEAAKAGTLFLDEIGELPLDLQAKLLRVLETGDFLRVGDITVQKADVRIIAATHHDLLQESAEGRFRQDLYYRLATFTLRIPALVERKADIPLLAQVFITRFAARLGKTITGMDEDVKRKLMDHTWPGHVRELRNVIERACILCDGPLLDPASLPLELQGEPEQKIGAIYELEQVEREHIRRVLSHTGGNKTLAAELLGIGLTTLYAKVKRFGLV
ncbi:MAG: sigma-54-dependent Fis family transcriptional regulator [Flavobacteriales bacterium]|nr:sigma-54-dependent Fis family transcriptional regulator [Flavobacteriales bacterium]